MNPIPSRNPTLTHLVTSHLFLPLPVIVSTKVHDLELTEQIICFTRSITETNPHTIRGEQVKFNDFASLQYRPPEIMRHDFSINCRSLNWNTLLLNCSTFPTAPPPLLSLSLSFSCFCLSLISLSLSEP